MAAQLLEAVRKAQEPVDVTTAQMQAVSAAYTFHPPLAWQRPGISDVEGGRYVDYTNVMNPAVHQPAEMGNRNPLLGFF